MGSIGSLVIVVIGKDRSIAPLNGDMVGVHLPVNDKQVGGIYSILGSRNLQLVVIATQCKGCLVARRSIDNIAREEELGHMQVTHFCPVVVMFPFVPVFVDIGLPVRLSCRKVTDVVGIDASVDADHRQVRLFFKAFGLCRQPDDMRGFL